MKMNVKLLRKVKAHILAEPARYNQNTIVSFGEPGEQHTEGHAYPACGTVACIGGWVDLLSRDRKLKHRPWGLNYRRIGRLLGVGKDSVGRLVAFSRADAEMDALVWPARFARRYNKAKTAKTRAKIAAERIEHFIATKGAE